MKKLIYLTACISIIIGQNKINGVTYFDYTNDLPTASGFNFTRQYISVSGNSGENIKYKVVLDIGRTNVGTVQIEDGEDDAGNMTYTEKSEDIRLSAFLKKAQVDYSTDFGKLSFGLIGMNTYGVQEKNWGYRFIQKSAIDKNKFSSTVDIGIGDSNSFIDNLHLSAQLTNGEGYKKEQGDKFYKFSLNTTYGEKKLTKNDGYNVGFVFSTIPAAPDSVNINMMSGFAGYAGNNLRIGAEYDMQTAGDFDETIMSFSINYGLLKNMDTYVRYDIYDDNADDTEMNGEDYLIFGLLFDCKNGLSVAPNLRITSFENSSMDDKFEYKINFQFKF